MLSKDLGNWAEKKSLSFLKKKGLIHVTHNFHGPGGEIDLIMRDKDLLVFIEVKFRKNTRYYDPVESINNIKCRKIIATSRYFLQKYKLGNVSCRFDVILIIGNRFAYQIEWIKNAFQA